MRDATVRSAVRGGPHGQLHMLARNVTDVSTAVAELTDSRGCHHHCPSLSTLARTKCTQRHAGSVGRRPRGDTVLLEAAPCVVPRGRLHS